MKPEGYIGKFNDTIANGIDRCILFAPNIFCEMVPFPITIPSPINREKLQEWEKGYTCGLDCNSFCPNSETRFKTCNTNYQCLDVASTALLVLGRK